MGIVGVEPSAADEPAQYTSADAGLDRGDIGLAEGGQLADAKLTLVEVEQCVDDTAVTNPPGADLGACKAREA